MTSSIQPRIQRIQAAISQANLQGQMPGQPQGQMQGSPAAKGQSRVCSFDIEGRTQEGYLGVYSIAEVTPPWFPKDAFQVRGRRDRPASPIITLKRSEPVKAAVASVTTATSTPQQTPQVATQAPSQSPAQSSAQAPAQAPIQSSVSVDIFQAVAGLDPELVQAELPLRLAPSQIPSQISSQIPSQALSEALSEDLASAPVTAEILANLFDQAAPISPGPEVAPSLAQSDRADPRLAYDPNQKQPHKAILAPVSPIEQAAAEALAQSLNQSPNQPAETSLDSSPDREADPLVKPIEAVAPPALPRSKSPELSSHHNSTNPMLPLELLQNIGQEVIVWQEALKEVHQNIQTLYQEGPILSGWLEKHADAGVYLLCGIDPGGESWRRPCHPDQLEKVGLAIGRYKKLRLLLGEKQRLEQRIKRLSETLTMLRLRLRAY